MLTVLRRSCRSQPRLFIRGFAEIVPVASGHGSRPSAPPPLRGTIDPPPTRVIAGPDGSSNASNDEFQVAAPARLGNRIPVRADHGLYAFFRKKEPDAGQTLIGEAQFETLGGSIEMERTRSGRSWKASELRLKSFEDLHALWYILLRERNLLATQEEEVRRLGVMKAVQTFNNQIRMCRKSMARIKYVMNERRLAYEGAVTLAEEEKMAHLTNLVLKQQTTEYRTEREHLLGRQKRAKMKAVREAKRVKVQAKMEAQAKTEAQVEMEAQAKTEVQAEMEAETETEVRTAVVQLDSERGTVTAQPESVEVKTNTPEESASLEPVETKTDAPEVVQSQQVIEKSEQTTKFRPSQSESASEAATAGLFGTRGRRR
ncbi:mitochondrial 39-S ribosomal protein L47 (MRP-L47)-domain-containing protein [Lentinula lateritia]|uniref:Mitochondrial 39-S ribosomal protein L47 (MRP-L47)-domain-containing protein n=1 Tax=Lentinula aff. lateritia TaxID=2804960 RepID=A0ACC1U968_9AGAR|nr:mitochondrial 39-S ribosomal protein L47 (MRP-L47)-domain-containing protein [Lentinula aff. lateritia]KAJ3854457.1 mitochondrial 39-S ribosomal protein L47 (MRP-L47)-domain-containing protein [Lentinula lateritia]